MSDITDHEKLQQQTQQVAKVIQQHQPPLTALHDAEQQFHELLDSISEISIQGYNEDREVTFWNTASEKIYKYSRDEAMGKKLENLIIPEAMRNTVIELHHRWLHYGEPIPAGELILVNKYGEDVPVYSSHSMILTPVGQEMFCIDIDLAPLRKAEAEKLKALSMAEEARKMALVGEVAGKMAHDFNNVLNIIMGNAELALSSLPDANSAETFRLICEQTLRGRSLTKNLMTFSKDNEPQERYFPLNDKAGLVVTLLKKDLGEIRILQDYASDLPDVLADPGMIENALVNLVQNAIHAVSLDKQPTISIRTFTANNQICLQIEDNGCGIPKDCIDKIFNPSFSLKGDRDNAGLYRHGIEGSGYGMANIKRCIERHQGSISVHSVQREGTTITIQFPIINKTQAELDAT